MYQKSIDLSPGETLLIEWGRKFSNLSIHKNGIFVGSIQDRNELKTGRRFHLPEGGEIMVLVTHNGLEIWHNGKELVSGLASGQSDGFGMAYKALAIFGGLELVVALLFFILLNSEIVVWMIALVAASGVILLGLSYWAWRHRSKLPLQIAMVICAVHLVLPIVGGRLLWVILLYYLIKGTQAKPLHTAQTKQMDPDGPLDSGI